MLRKVENEDIRRQLISFERIFFINKTTYKSRNNFCFIQTAKLGVHVHVDWDYMMHNYFYADVLGKDKR